MERFYGFDYPARTACAVIEEMRDCFKTLNFSVLLSLMEELQVIASRMEAGLERKNNINDAEDYIRKLKKEIKELEKKKNGRK